MTALPDPRATLATARAVVALPRRRGRWCGEHAYLLRLHQADVLVATAAVVVSYLLRFGLDTPQRLTPLLLGCAFPLVWPLLLEAMRAYEPRFLQFGTEEFRRVMDAGMALGLGGALVSYALKAELPRGFLLALVVAATGGTLLERLALRKHLHHQRRAGRGWMRRAVVAGHAEAVTQMVGELRRGRWHGYDVAAVCLSEEGQAHVLGAPVVVGLDRMVEAAEQARADTVILQPCRHLDALAVRRIAWSLEKSGTQLLLVTGLLDVAPRRTTIGLVGSLPVVHVAHPELSGWRRLAKEVFDRVGAAVGLVLVAPVLLLLMAAIRLDSPGPALFVQERVGRRDQRFRMLKLRTMTVDAEHRRGQLADRNQADGLLFKVHDDPRMTRLGRWLRRYSLDELPQLVNVLLGSMSLVGPRPPLPEEVDRYPVDVRRRLVVKPGMTGLWQVSGRANLEWEQAVRLDLRYVENWSLMMDLSILWKTMRAVISRDGAY